MLVPAPRGRAQYGRGLRRCRDATQTPALKRKMVDMMFDTGIRLVDAQEKVKAAEAIELPEEQ